MKKILAFLLLLFSLHMFAGTVGTEVQENENVVVELKEGKSDKTDRHPRTLIPITCVYVDGTVQLTILKTSVKSSFL